MREILFRGKRISNGEWVEGGILQQSHPNFDNGNCYCICANNKDYFVEQNTIGQYTGLTDKNGRKIFEGDILLFIDRECLDDILRELVAWNGFSWVTRMGKRDIVMSKWECEHMEVIGNIFDNPELLRGGTV